MIVDYETYKELGYCQISELSFIPIMADAEAAISKLTFGRLTLENATEENKRGLCRLAELYDSREKSKGESGAPVTSFRNGEYSENYDGGAYSADNFNAEVLRIVADYFTAEQLYRGG